MKERKRHIYAWILLAVFVPMIVMSSLHIHHEVGTADECPECVHHHCSGHLTQGYGGAHQCLLCQFLSISFCAATIIVVAFYNNRKKTALIQRQSDLRLISCGFISLRAPPFV